VTMHSFVRRIPMAIGPILGGTLIMYFGDKTGVRLAFCVALVLAIFSLIVQQLMIDDDGKRKSDATLHPWKALKYLHPDLRNLLVSDILIRFCEQIPYAFAVVWCVKLNNISALNFGILSAVEMATSMLIYVPVAYFADRTTKKPFVVATFCFFTAFPPVLYFSHSFWALIGAFIIRGLKEFGEPTRKALIMDLAPEDKKAVTFGLYYLIRDIIVSIASFGGAFLWDPSAFKKLVELTGFGGNLVPWFEKVACPELNLLAAFAFGLIGTIYFAAFGKDLKKTE
ncbi:MAG: MFS transporter, partial [Victivallales bacterium]